MTYHNMTDEELLHAASLVDDALTNELLARWTLDRNKYISFRGAVDKHSQGIRKILGEQYEF